MSGFDGLCIVSVAFLARVPLCIDHPGGHCIIWRWVDWAMDYFLCMGLRLIHTISFEGQKFLRDIYYTCLYCNGACTSKLFILLLKADKDSV